MENDKRVDIDATRWASDDSYRAFLLDRAKRAKNPTVFIATRGCEGTIFDVGGVVWKSEWTNPNGGQGDLT